MTDTQHHDIDEEVDKLADDLASHREWNGPTPEAVARELVSEFTWSTARDQLGVSANHEEIVTRIAAVLRQRDRAARSRARKIAERAKTKQED